MKDDVKLEGYTLDQGLAAVRPGWAELVRAAFAAKPDDVAIVQVKEKFGGLRIYTRPHNEMYAEVINDLERASFTICDVCGDQGEPREKGYWIRTTCQKHFDERYGNQ